MNQLFRRGPVPSSDPEYKTDPRDWQAHGGPLAGT